MVSAVQRRVKVKEWEQSCSLLADNVTQGAAQWRCGSQFGCLYLMLKKYEDDSSLNSTV